MGLRPLEPVDVRPLRYCSYGRLSKCCQFTITEMFGTRASSI